MKTKIYANYGVLAHEYQTIYTVSNPHVHATCHDIITVEIPDKYQPYITVDESIALIIDGTPYMLDEVIASTADKPCIKWYNGSTYHTERLTVTENQ